MPNLTDLSVQRLPEGVHFDTKTPGFGVRVGKRRKTWLVVKGQNRTKVTLGHYPSMSLAEARKSALVALGSPEAIKSHISYEEALDTFLALPRWRPSSKRVLESSLKHFQWKRSLEKITHEDVAQALEAIKAPSARAHALKDIRTFFNWCVPRYLPQSPCVGLKMPSQPSRDRILTEDELRTIWTATAPLEPFHRLIRLLLLTGQRRGEIGGLHWGMVKDDRVTLPADFTKNGKEHTFPLGDLARATFPPRGNGYVFPNSLGKPFTAYAFNFQKLLKETGIDDITMHDLRRTYVSIHAQLGTPIHIAEKLVNHVSGTFGGVRGVYDRYSYFDEMRSACERYEAHLSSLCS